MSQLEAPSAIAAGRAIRNVNGSKKRAGNKKVSKSRVVSTNNQKKTYNLPNSLTRQFEDIATRIGANSDTEVVKAAIRFFLFLHQNMDDGDSLVLDKQDGDQYKLAPFI